MTKQTSDNVIEFPGEYLMEQRQRDRWLTIASCSIVIGSDEPMACVEMILDKFGDVPNQIVHMLFAPKTPPEALIKPDRMQEAASAATENVFNEWIDAWLPACPW